MTAAGRGLRGRSAASRFRPTIASRLTTPRGFADPAKAVAALDKVAGEVEQEYGRLAVPWGDVLRFRRGNVDLPGNGAPSALGAIRTVNAGPFVNGKAEGVARRHLSSPSSSSRRRSSRRGASQLRQLVEEGLAARRRPDARCSRARRCGRCGATARTIEANLESRKTF